MTAILALLRASIPFLAGIGIGKIADKTLADKVPNYPAEGLTTGLTGKKIVFWVLLTVAGALVTRFIGKKLNIKLLK
jgi:hypothetical protein